MNYTVSYAQNREDIILNAFFDEEEKGFYIDVGAEAPTALSVTKIFYDKGWRGINIEPIMRQYELLVTERPRDVNLNVGVSDRKGVLHFREYEGSGYSTFSNDMKKEHQKDEEALVKEYRDYNVKTLTLKDICEEYKVTSIQFLKVDVEGLEYEVLKGNDWQKFRPEVLCIEANHIKNNWRTLLEKQHYRLVFFDGLNEYYVDNNTNRADHFNYVQKVVFKEPIIRFEVADKLHEDQVRISELDKAWRKNQDELILARNQTKELQSALHDITPLRRHILRSVKRRIHGIDHEIMKRLSRDGSFTPLPLTGPEFSEKDLFSNISDYDKRNYEHYARLRKGSSMLPLYLRIKTASHRFARKALTKARAWK